MHRDLLLQQGILSTACARTSSWQNQGVSATAAARIAKHRHMRNMLLLIMPVVVGLDEW